MRFIALIVSILVAAMTMLFALKSSNPTLYLKLALTFDFIGISGNANDEKLRLEQIDLLPVSQDKKNILTNHTIFLGATPSMVTLALGKPDEVIHTPDGSNAVATERWIYHFEQDVNPTRLEFHEGILSAASRIEREE
jgi:hypothetical protein